MERAVKLDPNNGIAAQVLRIYLFEQQHPGVREGHHPTTQSLRSEVFDDSSNLEIHGGGFIQLVEYAHIQAVVDDQ